MGGPTTEASAMRDLICCCQSVYTDDGGPRGIGKSGKDASLVGDPVAQTGDDGYTQVC